MRSFSVVSETGPQAKVFVVAPFERNGHRHRWFIQIRNHIRNRIRMLIQIQEPKESGAANKRGQRILTEKPFAFVLKSQYRLERCDNCLEA